jgi:vitamin-K-epoxide reductase (warfarin-sensitive)
MLFVLCVCGTLLSSYAVYIERSKEADSSYKAHCDLDETIACTHVLTSE